MKKEENITTGRRGKGRDVETILDETEIKKLMRELMADGKLHLLMALLIIIEDIVANKSAPARKARDRTPSPARMPTHESMRHLMSRVTEVLNQGRNGRQAAERMLTRIIEICYGEDPGWLSERWAVKHLVVDLMATELKCLRHAMGRAPLNSAKPRIGGKSVKIV